MVGTTKRQGSAANKPSGLGRGLGALWLPPLHIWYVGGWLGICTKLYICTLSMNTIKEVLTELSISSYPQYVRSNYFLTLEQVLLDYQSKCEVPTCKSKSKYLSFLAITLPGFLGVNPSVWCALCPEHFTTVGRLTEGRKPTEKVICDRTFCMVSRLRKTSGKSNYQIGLWFKDRFLSDQYHLAARTIYTRLEPASKQFIEDLILQGRIGTRLATYFRPSI